MVRWNALDWVEEFRARARATGGKNTSHLFIRSPARLRPGLRLTRHNQALTLIN